MILASSDGSTLVSSTRKGTHLCEKQAAAVRPAGQPEHICRYRPRLTEANGPRRRAVSSFDLLWRCVPALTGAGVPEGE